MMRILSRTSGRSQGGGMILLGLFTCLFLGMTCLPIIFSVGILVHQRVNMSLAAQNAAFAGTAETDRDSKVVDLIQDRAAQRAAEVLESNLETNRFVSSWQQQYGATITVHDPMDGGREYLTTDSLRDNPECDRPVQPEDKPSPRPGMAYKHDINDCWVDTQVEARHRSPGLTIVLEGNVEVCASWMAAIFDPEGRPCARMMRMRTEGYADMATENPVDTLIKVLVDGPSNVSPDLDDGVARFSWEAIGGLEVGGSTFHCKLYSFNPETGSRSTTAVRDVPNCGNGSATGSYTFTGLTPGHYEFEVELTFVRKVGVPAEGQPQQTEVVPRTGNVVRITVPPGAGSARAVITAYPRLPEAGQNVLRWAVEPATTTRTPRCLLWSRPVSAGAFLEAIKSAPDSEATVVDCDAYQGKVFGQDGQVYRFDIYMPAQGDQPAQAKRRSTQWFLGVPAYSPSITFTMVIAGQPIPAPFPGSRQLRLSINWQDDPGFAGTNNETERQAAISSNSNCRVERLQGADWVTYDAGAALCARGDFTVNGNGVAYAKNVFVESGYKYRFVIQLATQPFSFNLRSGTSDPKYAREITWSFSRSSAGVLGPDSLTWSWKVTGDDLTPTCTYTRMDTQDSGGVIRVVAGSATAISGTCTDTGGVVSTTLVADKAYCLRMSGALGAGGTVSGRIGWLYRVQAGAGGVSEIDCG